MRKRVHDQRHPPRETSGESANKSNFSQNWRPAELRARGISESGVAVDDDDDTSGMMYGAALEMKGAKKKPPESRYRFSSGSKPGLRDGSLPSSVVDSRRAVTPFADTHTHPYAHKRTCPSSAIGKAVVDTQPAMCYVPSLVAFPWSTERIIKP